MMDPRFENPPAEEGEGSTTIIPSMGQRVEENSPLDPRNPLLYGPLENEVVGSLSQAKQPDPTIKDITREGQRAAAEAVTVDPRFAEPPSDFEQTPTVDIAVDQNSLERLWIGLEEKNTRIHLFLEKEK